MFECSRLADAPVFEICDSTLSRNFSSLSVGGTGDGYLLYSASDSDNIYKLVEVGGWRQLLRKSHDLRILSTILFYECVQHM
jgi:hypothetical protein